MPSKFWNKVSTLSFNTKATLLAIGLGTIPIVATGTFNYLQIRSTLEQQTSKTQTARAEAIADKLNRFMLERYGDIEVLATLQFLTNPKVAAITSIADKSEILEQYVKSSRVYDSIAAFDTKGNLIAQSKGEPLKKNHLQRKYFQDVLKTGRVVISDPEASMYTGKISLFFAAPIRDSTGQMIGVVRTRFPADRLETAIKNFATKSEDYHILDRQNNKIFISSNGEYTNRPETPDMEESRLKGRAVEHLNRVSDHQQQAIDASDPTKGSEQDHRELFTSAPFTKLEGMQELPWTAVAAIDLDTAHADLQGLLLTILAGAGVTTLFTVAVSSFFADRIAKYIQRTIATITNSANDIVDTVQLQELNVNEQANSAIATTDTINELESISTQTAAQASASATGAQQALTLAEDGTRSVQETLTGMSGLRLSVDEIAAQIVNLSEQTGQITNVSDLVADLAKQTNMLALKAAVEAARVGEQGKGFGVVAGEIRKLAEESKKSAQKINTLATDIQISIDRTVMVTDRGTKTVTEGIQLAENTAATFVGVKDAVDRVFVNSQQISASAKQQATAIQQVLGAMTSISQGSQESAVGMHRVKTSTRELNQIADELQAVVS